MIVGNPIPQPVPIYDAYIVFSMIAYLLIIFLLFEILWELRKKK